MEQSPSALSVQEGASPTLRCNFSKTVDNVQWFRQNPGSGLIRLFYIASGTKENGRLKSTMNSRERYSTLHIAASQLADSGTYLCAARHSAPRSPAACTQTAAGPASPPLSERHVSSTAVFALLGVSCSRLEHVHLWTVTTMNSLRS